jgi:hypothetical protein
MNFTDHLVLDQNITTTIVDQSIDLEKNSQILILYKNIDLNKENENCKNIINNIKLCCKEKIPKVRIITSSKKWIKNLTYENQINLIHKKENLLIQQLKNKLYSYKSQDNEKKKYDKDKFVNIDYVISILLKSNLKCYYCNKDVKVLYEIVREDDQWTLDRLDNDYGHNIDNVVISCLKCNIRKKIIHPDKYVNTKKCINVIKLDYTDRKEK